LPAREALIEALRVAPERMQAKLALALASNQEGAEALLELTQEAKVSPRLLLEPSVKERIAAAKPADFSERIEKLTKGLSPVNEEVQKIIDARRAKFNPAKANAGLGAKVFTKTCTVCHSMDNQGGAVGRTWTGWAIAAWNGCWKMCWTRAEMLIPPSARARSH